MSHKSWMLSAAAIKVAKECIKTVEGELGVRLSLTHPDFLQMLNDYSEMCECENLTRHVQALNRFAASSAGVAATEKSSVVELKATGTHRAVVTSGVSVAPPAPVQAAAPAPAPAQPPQQAAQDRVEYKGKSYPRFLNGKEFKGLYRGQPQYA